MITINISNLVVNVAAEPELRPLLREEEASAAKRLLSSVESLVESAQKSQNTTLLLEAVDRATRLLCHLGSPAGPGPGDQNTGPPFEA